MNGQLGQNLKWGKLDRALVIQTFLQHYFLAHVEFGQRYTYNHKPLVVNFSQKRDKYVPPIFKYQTMWFTHFDFLHFMK